MMKGPVYVVALLLSLPNLLAGLALLVIRHTFSSRNPFQIMSDFLFEIEWGLPLAAALFVFLLVLGILSSTRPYTALFAFVLNAAALGFVLSRIGLPSHFEGAVVFLPVLLALIGFAWLAYALFVPGPPGESEKPVS